MTNILKNDKSTVKDELILLLIILGCLLTGGLLIVCKPAFWLITNTHTVVLGVLFILMGVMFIPGLIYRLFENHRR